MIRLGKAFEPATREWFAVFLDTATLTLHALDPDDGCWCDALCNLSDVDATL
jgi:hypothetical protein